MPKPHLKLKTSQGIMTFKPQDLSAHLAVSRPFFSGFDGWLPNPDPVLRKMGRQISVYRELMRDPCPCGRIFLHPHKTPIFSLHNTA